MRSETHITETEAKKIVNNQIPSDKWVLRSIDERDYGTDFMIEIFENSNPTGDCFFVQSKGTVSSFDETVKLSFPVKTIKYALLFNVPFFIFYTSIPSNETKYIWLQKYVEIHLNNKNQKWQQQESVTITFPEENDLSSNIEKVNELLMNHRATSQSLAFLKVYEELVFHAKNVLSGEFGVGHTCVIYCYKLVKLNWLINYLASNTCVNIERMNIFNMKDAFEEIASTNIIDNENRNVITEQLKLLRELKQIIISTESREELGCENYGLFPF